MELNTWQKEELIKSLNKQKTDIFATKGSTTEALDYAVSLGKAEGMEAGYMTIAIMIYHNTLVDQLIKQIAGVNNDKG